VIMVGEPIDPPGGSPVRRGEIAALTERLRESLQRSFDEAERLCYYPTGRSVNSGGGAERS
jgi:hypothetical protein